MLKSAILLFILAAIFGSILIWKVFKNSPRPIVLILLHGLFASSGLISFLIYAIWNLEIQTYSNLILFGLATLCAFVMFEVDMSKEQIPRVVVLIHAVAAVIGHILLISFVSNLKIS
jgi:hypothetical protein